MQEVKSPTSITGLMQGFDTKSSNEQSSIKLAIANLFSTLLADQKSRFDDLVIQYATHRHNILSTDVFNSIKTKILIFYPDVQERAKFLRSLHEKLRANPDTNNLVVGDMLGFMSDSDNSNVLYIMQPAIADSLSYVKSQREKKQEPKYSNELSEIVARALVAKVNLITRVELNGENVSLYQLAVTYGNNVTKDMVAKFYKDEEIGAAAGDSKMNSKGVLKTKESNALLYLLITLAVVSLLLAVASPLLVLVSPSIGLVMGVFGALIFVACAAGMTAIFFITDTPSYRANNYKSPFVSNALDNPEKFRETPTQKITTISQNVTTAPEANSIYPDITPNGLMTSGNVGTSLYPTSDTQTNTAAILVDFEFPPSAITARYPDSNGEWLSINYQAEQVDPLVSTTMQNASVVECTFRPGDTIIARYKDNDGKVQDKVFKAVTQENTTEPKR